MIATLRSLLRRAYREAIPFLYGRTNYKLFLQRTFESLDHRVVATLCATNAFPGFLRPVPLKAPFGRRLLVVAPHQDDEIIGCGGVMLLQRAAGAGVEVVFTQDGGDEHAADGRSRADQVRIREGEARSVAAAIGIPEPRFLRFTTLIGEENRALADALRVVLEKSQPEAVFAPFLLDYNRHHQLTNFALAEALASSRLTPRIFGYEVWGLAIPNVIVCIDSVQEEKQRLLRMYASQLSGKDYAHGVAGLNMYHSLHFGAGECRFAERFFEIPAADYIALVRRIRTSLSSQEVETPPSF